MRNSGTRSLPSSGETGTRKSILITMVTSYGVKENMYSDAVQSHVVMDDLFA